MPHRARALFVAAIRGTDHHRRAHPAVGTLIGSGDSVFQLLIRGADIIDKLNLRKRHASLISVSDRAAEYTGLIQLGVEHSIDTERPLQIAGSQKYAAFAFKLARYFLSFGEYLTGEIGHVLAEYNGVIGEHEYIEQRIVDSRAKRHLRQIFGRFGRIEIAFAMKFAVFLTARFGLAID